MEPLHLAIVSILISYFFLGRFVASAVGAYYLKDVTTIHPIIIYFGLMIALQFVGKFLYPADRPGEKLESYVKAKLRI